VTKSEILLYHNLKQTVYAPKAVETRNNHYEQVILFSFKGIIQVLADGIKWC